MALSASQPSLAPQAPPQVGTQTTTENTRVHDPVMIKQGGTYYLFSTGFGISNWASKDLENWERLEPIFAEPPQWAVKAIPSFKGHIWAPDITFHNGKYYLYYSVSAFGKNTSCIGLVVNKTLDPTSPDYRWEDKGKVIESIPGRDLWNAIDPNLAFDENDTPWLSFGSFWDGLKLVKLNADLSSLAEPQEWYTISRRPRDFSIPETDAGDGAVEAPFIFKKNHYYYLFVSFDYCCRAEKSDYKIAVGRSEKITGPYLDKKGVRMDRNGGSIVLQGDKDWYGVGHNATYHFDGKDYLVFHGYDVKDKGRSKLRIEELQWDAEGWPFVASQK
jgi:arabinan endo-1,5-alpha-L-arabinosidase